MAGAASNFAAGYRMGTGARERSGRESVVEGLQEYRSLIEGEESGVLPLADPGEQAAKLKQARDKFYKGLKTSNLDMGQATAMMTAFNSVNTQYALKQGAEAMAGWGTDAALPALNRTLSSILGREVTTEFTSEMDEFGRPVAIAYYDDDDDPETKERQMPFTYDQSGRWMAGMEGDPRSVMAFNKDNLELNEQYKDYAAAPSVDERIAGRETAGIQAAETHAADLARSQAATMKDVASADESLADAEYARVRAAGGGGRDIDIGRLLQSAAYQDALDLYGDTNPEFVALAQSEPAAFSEAAGLAIDRIRQTRGNNYTPTPQEVYSYMARGE